MYNELLEPAYRRRLGGDVEFRKKMYRVLCRGFFDRYIPPEAVVLDVGAGYCEFINNVRAKRKIAVDLNPDARRFAEDDVEVILSTSTDLKQVQDETVDVAFTSNFFEHLSKEDIVKTVREIYRVLKPGGRFLILQPNIRYCYKDYWMFFDHITPLDDRSLAEVLEVIGFKVVEGRPRFLPYTTKGKLPRSLFLIKIYLKISCLHKIFGKQAFIFARK